MKTQQKKKRLRNQADRLYQQVGLLINDICLICGSEADCIHHYVPKSVSSALRYDLENGIPICQSCHCKIHSSPDPKENIIIYQKKGEEWWNDLQKKKYRIIKESLRYYQEIIKELQETYDLYRGKN